MGILVFIRGLMSGDCVVRSDVLVCFLLLTDILRNICGMENIVLLRLAVVSVLHGDGVWCDVMCCFVAVVSTFRNDDDAEVAVAIAVNV